MLKIWGFYPGEDSSLREIDSWISNIIERYYFEQVNESPKKRFNFDPRGARASQEELARNVLPVFVANRSEEGDLPRVKLPPGLLILTPVFGPTVSS